MLIRNAQYLKASEIIEAAKKANSITKPNSRMKDVEIREVVRWAALSTPGTFWNDEKMIFSRVGIDLMLFLTLMTFPKFYKRHGLSQFN